MSLRSYDALKEAVVIRIAPTEFNRLADPRMFQRAEIEKIRCSKPHQKMLHLNGCNFRRIPDPNGTVASTAHTICLLLNETVMYSPEESAVIADDIMSRDSPGVSVLNTFHPPDPYPDLYWTN